MTKKKAASQGDYLLNILAGVVLVSSAQAAVAQTKTAPDKVPDAKAHELALMSKARRATADGHYEAACDYLADACCQSEECRSPLSFRPVARAAGQV